MLRTFTITPGLLTQMGTLATHTRSAKKYKRVNYMVETNGRQKQWHERDSHSWEVPIHSSTHRPVKVEVVTVECYTELPHIYIVVD